MNDESIQRRAEGLKASPAFPISFDHLHPVDAMGMTMREYAAIELMKGLLSNPEYLDVTHLNPSPSEAADDALGYADALLEKLAKPEKKTEAEVVGF